MPNWCINSIIIEGSTERLKQFDEQFKKEHTRWSGGTSSVTPETLEERLNECIQKGHESHVSTGTTGLQLTYIEKEEVITGYSFRNFIDMTKEDFLNGWYDWAVRNWGTKWDISPDEASVSFSDDTSICYNLSTAWSPCIPVVEEMAKQYPDLKFRHEYEECGMEFAGVLEYVDGELSYSAESENDNFREFLQEHFGAEYYKCSSCGALLEEYDLDDNDGKCPDCDSDQIYDTDGITLLKIEEEE